MAFRKGKTTLWWFSPFLWRSSTWWSLVFKVCHTSLSSPRGSVSRNCIDRSITAIASLSLHWKLVLCRKFCFHQLLNTVGKFHCLVWFQTNIIWSNPPSFALLYIRMYLWTMTTLRQLRLDDSLEPLCVVAHFCVHPILPLAPTPWKSKERYDKQNDWLEEGTPPCQKLMNSFLWATSRTCWVVIARIYLCPSWRLPQGRPAQSQGRCPSGVPLSPPGTRPYLSQYMRGQNIRGLPESPWQASLPSCPPAHSMFVVTG